jgi:phosphoribosyl 1,2-cyclic phosphodiesterase
MYKFRFCILGSGSRGNATYYEPHGDGHGFMIDIGFPDKRIESGLAGINRSPEMNINAVLISHEHGDHLSKSKKNIVGLNKYFLKSSDFFSFSPECLITRFSLIHDTKCYGFLIEAENTRVAHVTDTGDIPCKSLKHFLGLHALVIEANWDELLIDDMIDEGNVPLSRIEHSMDDHLSNQQMAELLKAVAWPGLEYVVLIHLSESNNTPELALQAAEFALGEYWVGAGGGCRVIVSSQDKATPLIILRGDV